MPWAAIIPAVISAVGSYVASRQAAKAGKPTALEKQLQQTTLDNIRQSSPYALGFLDTAKQNIGAASDFGNSLMRGGFQNALGLLGPELSANARGNEAAFNSSLRQLPRGGGTGSQRLGLMDSMQSNRNNALVGLRPTAANMLASIGSSAGGLGSGLLGMSNSGNLGLLNYGLQNRQGSFDMSRQAMYGVLQALGGINWGGGGGSQPSTLPTQQPGWVTSNPSLLKPGT